MIIITNENDAFPGWTNQPVDNDIGEQSYIEWEKKMSDNIDNEPNYETSVHWEEQKLIEADVPSEGTLEDTHNPELLEQKTIYDSWDTTTRERIKEAFDSIVSDVIAKIIMLQPTESFTIDNLGSYICQNDGETILILGNLSDNDKDIDTFWFPTGTIHKNELMVYYASQQ